jgi:hypothetical protein
MASIEVAIYRDKGKQRSRKICDRLKGGILSAGDRPREILASTYRKPEAEVAVFYGLREKLGDVFEDYRAAGLTTVYIDLGYWGRRWNYSMPGIGHRYGYHKFVVNARHATDYFQKVKHDSRRLRALRTQCKINVEPWRKRGEHILLAGSSAKSAGVDGLEPQQWERDAVARLRAVTDRPIFYRAKPSWKDATPIDGSTWRPAVKWIPGEDKPRAVESTEAALRNAWAVVTHHSNVAIDGLLSGIPAFVDDGLALPMASQDLSLIERPFYPDEREQWLNDITYTQFNMVEMQDGTAWKHLKSEGLVP